MTTVEEEENIKCKLIELVKEEPVLWDQRNPVYKSRKQAFKNLIWERFAGRLGLADGKWVIKYCTEYTRKG
jgi:hypothetical protein